MRADQPVQSVPAASNFDAYIELIICCLLYNSLRCHWDQEGKKPPPPQKRVTPLHTLYRCMLLDRVWFLAFVVEQEGITKSPFCSGTGYLSTPQLWCFFEMFSLVMNGVQT